MALRPARVVRSQRGQAWARISWSKPDESFVKGAPQPKVRQYEMGVEKAYDTELRLVAEEYVNLRDNAIEAARTAANKALERAMGENYHLRVAKFPHHVLREHALLGMAGADRISKGMKLAFGRPKGRAARIKRGDAFLVVRCFARDAAKAEAALSIAKKKISGRWKIVAQPIAQ